MDTRTGEIYTPEEAAALVKKLGLTPEEQKERFKRIHTPPTLRQMARKPPRIGLNDPCGCGSGRKFKKCCWTGGKNE